MMACKKRVFNWPRALKFLNKEVGNNLVANLDVKKLSGDALVNVLPALAALDSVKIGKMTDLAYSVSAGLLATMVGRGSTSGIDTVDVAKALLVGVSGLAAGVLAVSAIEGLVAGYLLGAVIESAFDAASKFFFRWQKMKIAFFTTINILIAKSHVSPSPRPIPAGGIRLSSISMAMG